MNRGNPLGLGLILIGASMVAISAFLPLLEPIGMFRLIQQNALIQQGGWVYVAGAVALAAAGVRGFINVRDWSQPLIVSVIGVVGMIVWAANTGMRTLYPVGPNGDAITTGSGQVADWGIAIYVA